MEPHDSPPNSPPPAKPTPAPAADPAPPPAGTVVANATRTERELHLERELAERDRLVKQRETEAAEAEDRYQNLKKATGAPPATTTTTAKPADDRSDLERFMDGD